jgi:hypothetical protein
LPSNRSKVMDLTSEDVSASLEALSEPTCLCPDRAKKVGRHTGRHRDDLALDLRDDLTLDLCDEDEGSAARGAEISSCLCAAAFVQIVSCSPGPRREDGSYRCLTQRELGHCRCGEWLTAIKNCQTCPLAGVATPDDSI